MSNEKINLKSKLPKPDSCEVDKIIEELMKKSEIDSKVDNNKILPQQKPVVEKTH
jgi:hypothetical protein